MTESKRAVAELAGARIPADHGLASLGLVMQLVGGVMLGVMGMAAMTPLFGGGGMNPLAWPMFLLGASGAVRAAYHRAAGTALIYGSPKGNLHGVKVYAGVAAAQTLIWIYVFKSELELPGSAVFAVALPLVAWPIALLAVIHSPRLRRYQHEPLPTGEDMGFEGAAVLMTLLGAIGLALSGLFLSTLLRAGGEVLSTGPGLLFLGTVVILGVRSFHHVNAGLKGTKGIDSDGASEAAARYFGFGIVSSVIVGGALMILLLMTALHPAALIMCAVIVYLLLLWPLVLRRFFAERNFAALLAGQDAPNHRRAPDAGLTALGWLLFAGGVYGLASGLPTALLGADDMLGNLGGLATGFGEALDLAAAADRSAWWSVVIAGVQLWAGVELVRMTDRHKLAGTIYGAAATAVALWVSWPLLSSASAALISPSSGLDSMMMFGVLAAQLVIPVGTILLVNRAVTPQAQARFKA